VGSMRLRSAELADQLVSWSVGQLVIEKIG
jgi:hypothetical protein